LIGVGVRTPASATATRHEVVCFLPRAGTERAVLGVVRKSVAPDANDLVTNQPMSNYIAHASVTSTGPLVRADLTMTSHTAPGYVVQLLFTRTVQFWDGSCTTQQFSQMHTC
jgi:hypothetical protein